MTAAPWTRGRMTPGLADLHPLLFAAYPVLFLWSQNLGEVEAADVAAPLLVAVVVAAAATALAGLVIRDVRRGALLVTPVVVAVLMYGHLHELLEPLEIPARVDLFVWAVLVGVGAIAAFRLSDRVVGQVTRGLARIGGLLVLVTLVMIIPSLVGGAAPGLSLKPPVTPLPTTTESPKRDVYWLVFDRYGSDRSLELMYGIRNDLTPWLRDQGFTVLDDSHANYTQTSLSMATTLNMRHLEPLVDAVGRESRDFGPIYESLHDPLVARQFAALGYEYHHIGSWWGPTRHDRGADVNHNVDETDDFSGTLFDTSALPTIGRVLGLVERRSSLETRHYAHNRYGLDTLASLRDVGGPKFVLAHILLPHPPYVFDADGSYIDPADAAGDSLTERWERQFRYTNARLREILGDLLALPPDERPIIILQADEGPWTDAYRGATDRYDWATATPEELEIKFGIINAWYVPGGEDLGLYPTMTSINTFPVLFSRYFGLDYELLPDRVATSQDRTRPYALTDVTDRIPSLAGGQ